MNKTFNTPPSLPQSSAMGHMKMVATWRKATFARTMLVDENRPKNCKLKSYVLTKMPQKIGNVNTVGV